MSELTLESDSTGGERKKKVTFLTSFHIIVGIPFCIQTIIMIKCYKYFRVKNATTMFILEIKCSNNIVHQLKLSLKLKFVSHH
jgi:Tfp pilus assembly major pilin PilA